MKKILRILSTATVGASMMLGMAAADTTVITCGNISGTGPGSSNNINCTDNQNNQVTCTNNVVVANTNNQTASSGGAFTVNNTTAGGAVTGDATNGYTFDLSANIGCAPVQTTAATTPSTPAAGGAGAGSAATPAASAPKAASLPETGSNTALEAGTIGVASLAGLAVVTRFGLSAYRRQALK